MFQFGKLSPLGLRFRLVLLLAVSAASTAAHCMAGEVVSITGDWHVSAGYTPGTGTVAAAGSAVNTNKNSLRNAIDGNPNTRWTSQQSQKPGIWFEIDLREPKTFNQLILRSWVDIRPERSSPVVSLDFPKQFDVRVSNHQLSDQAWLGVKPVFKGSNPMTASQAVVEVDAGNTIDPRNTINFASDQKNVQFIRVYLTATDPDNYYWWSISDIQINQLVKEPIAASQRAKSYSTNLATVCGSSDDPLAVTWTELSASHSGARHNGGRSTAPINERMTLDPDTNRLTWDEETKNNAANKVIASIFNAVDPAYKTRWTTGALQSPGMYFEAKFDQQTLNRIELSTGYNPTKMPAGSNRAYQSLDYPKAFKLELYGENNQGAPTPVEMTGVVNADGKTTICFNSQKATGFRITLDETSGAATTGAMTPDQYVLDEKQSLAAGRVFSNTVDPYWWSIHDIHLFDERVAVAGKPKFDAKTQTTETNPFTSLINVLVKILEDLPNYFTPATPDPITKQPFECNPDQRVRSATIGKDRDQTKFAWATMMCEYANGEVEERRSETFLYGADSIGLLPDSTHFKQVGHELVEALTPHLIDSAVPQRLSCESKDEYVSGLMLDYNADSNRYTGVNVICTSNRPVKPVFASTEERLQCQPGYSIKQAYIGRQSVFSDATKFDWAKINCQSDEREHWVDSKHFEAYIPDGSEISMVVNPHIEMTADQHELVEVNSRSDRLTCENENQRPTGLTLDYDGNLDKYVGVKVICDQEIEIIACPDNLILNWVDVYRQPGFDNYFDSMVVRCMPATGDVENIPSSDFYYRRSTLNGNDGSYNENNRQRYSAYDNRLSNTQGTLGSCEDVTKRPNSLELLYDKRLSTFVDTDLSCTNESYEPTGCTAVVTAWGGVNQTGPKYSWGPGCTTPYIDRSKIKSLWVRKNYVAKVCDTAPLRGLLPNRGKCAEFHDGAVSAAKAKDLYINDLNHEDYRPTDVNFNENIRRIDWSRKTWPNSSQAFGDYYGQADTKTIKDRQAFFRQKMRAVFNDQTKYGQVHSKNEFFAINAKEGDQLEETELNETLAGLPDTETSDFRISMLVRTLFLSNHYEQNGMYDAQIKPALQELHDAGRFWPKQSAQGEGEKKYVYWTENHILMWTVSAYLLHQRYGWSSQQEVESINKRLHAFLDAKLKYGFYEFFSSTYYRYTLGALLNLVDFADDQEIKEKATRAAERLMKEFLTVFNDRGALYPAAGRNYVERYTNYEPNPMFWILTGRGKMKQDSPGYIGGFISTTDMDLSAVANSYRSEVNTHFDQGHNLGSARAIYRTLPFYEQILFQWSHGGYFQTNTAPDTIKTINHYGFQERKEFTMLGGLVEKDPSTVAHFSDSITSSSNLSRAYVPVFKNKNTVLTSITNHHPYYRGWQQWPWVATVDDVAVWTQSGDVSDGFKQVAKSQNSHLPMVKQKDNVALMTYFPDFALKQIPNTNTNVTLYWPAHRFDEHEAINYDAEDDLSWLVARKNNSYIAVVRYGNQSFPGEPIANPTSSLNEGRQMWAVVVGNNETHGTYHDFKNMIRKATLNVSYEYDWKRFVYKFYNRIVVDGKEIETEKHWSLGLQS